MPQGARFVLNSKYHHIAQPGERITKYTWTPTHIENLIEYAGTRETVALNFDETAAYEPPTEKQKETINKFIRQAGLKNNDLVKNLEYNDYINNPTKFTASILIANLSEHILINGAFDEAANLIEYTAERPGVVKVGEHGLFSSTPNVDLEQAKKELSQHKGNIYTHVLSLRREDADRLGFDSQEPWKNLILSKIDVIAKAHNISVKDLHWYAAMHNTSYHPHVHLFVYADEESSQKPHLKSESIRALKSAFANEIFREDMHNTYVNKTEYRAELNKQSKELLNSLVQNPLDYYESEQLNALVDKMNELAAKLPTQGRMVYGYMPKDVKQLVDDIQRNLVYDNKILNQLYMQYCNCQYNIEQMYINEPQLAPVDKVKDFVVIKNDIIREAVKIRDSIGSEGLNQEDTDRTLDVVVNTNAEEITEYANSGELSGDNYLKSAYRKHLNYKGLEKDYPFLKGYDFQGDNAEKTFEALRVLSEDLQLRTGEICRELADHYYYGNGCERDINSAFMWYGIAADQFKDSYANYRLGQIYYNGADEIDVDTELGAYYSKTAYILFKNEVENSEFYSRLEEGNTNLSYFEKVSADDAYKEYLIGRLFLKGHGVEQDYSKAFYSFSLSAENGYAHANYYIGNMYYYGLGFEQNYKDAISYYETAAKEGDGYADYRLGKMHLKGEGVDIDLKEAEQYFKRSVNKVVMANYDLARLYESHSDVFHKPDEEIYALYKNALQGLIEQENELHDTFTEIRIGNMYLDGQGTDVSVEKAVEWLNKAAEQNNPDALYQLGFVFSSDKYSVADEEKAYEYYSRSLDGYIKAEEENANATAEYRIGRMCINGIGTEVNVSEGIHWLEKAALNNNAEAAYQLYKLYSEGTEIEGNPERAMQFLEISCYLDNPYAQYAFGKLKLEDGNLEEGIKWLESAADKDMPYASYKLGSIYSSDEYGVRDETKAQAYYAKALKLFEAVYKEQPDDTMAYQIGRMYLYGQGTNVSINNAAEWFEKAAAQNNPDAHYQLGYIYRNADYGMVNENLSAQHFRSAYEIFLKEFELIPNADTAYKIGSMYHYGLGVEQDIDKAIEWYKKSVELGNQKAQDKINNIEQQQKMSALSIASTAAHFGRIIDTETHAAMKQRYMSDSKVLRQEKVQKIKAGQAVDDHSQAFDY